MSEIWGLVPDSWDGGGFWARERGVRELRGRVDSVQGGLVKLKKVEEKGIGSEKKIGSDPRLNLNIPIQFLIK